MQRERFPLSRNKFVKIMHTAWERSLKLYTRPGIDRNFPLICVKKWKKKSEIKIRSTRSTKMTDMSINTRDYCLSYLFQFIRQLKSICINQILKEYNVPRYNSIVVFLGNITRNLRHIWRNYRVKSYRVICHVKKYKS